MQTSKTKNIKSSTDHNVDKLVFFIFTQLVKKTIIISIFYQVLIQRKHFKIVMVNILITVVYTVSP